MIITQGFSPGGISGNSTGFSHKNMVGDILFYNTPTLAKADFGKFICPRAKATGLTF
jgi:hypothetical protein